MAITVGQTVQFFHNDDPKFPATGGPFPAEVRLINGDGAVNLVVQHDPANWPNGVFTRAVQVVAAGAPPPAGGTRYSTE